MGFDLDAYLERIGLSGVEPDAAGLRALQEAQMRSIPFENFDPLLGKVPDLGLGEIFAKTVPGGRGGYCFELNLLFEAALGAVGFPVRRMLARVRMRGDNSAPRSHLALQVEAEGRSFLADAGFGGPGSLGPLELGVEGEQETPSGVFRLVADTETGETVLEARSGVGWVQLYGFDVAHVSEGEIAAANYACATWDQAPFGFHAMLGSYSGDARYGVFDRNLTVSRLECEERREFADFEDFAAVVKGEMGIGLDSATLQRAWDKIGGVG